MGRVIGFILLALLALPARVSAQSGAVEALKGYVSPVATPSIEVMATPRTLTGSERQRMEEILRGVNIRLPVPDDPGPGRAPEVPAETPPALSSAVAPQAPNDLVINQLVGLGAAAPAGFKSTIGEPTVSGYNDLVVQSGNWYLAASGDAGASWGFVDPFALMAGVDGGFCCDQVIRYEPSRDLLLVLLMSVASPVTNRNTLRLIVAQGIRSGCCNVFTYDFTPQALGLPAGQWHDYPKVTVGKNFVYITTNRFAPVTCPPCTFQGGTIYRLPLDPLKAGTGFSFSFFNPPQGSLLVAEGIGDSDTAYWGSNLTTSTLRVFRWAENSGTIFFSDVAVAPWSDASRVCVGPDGRDFGGRADGRLQTAIFSNRIDGVDGKQLLFGQSSAAQPAASRPFAYMRMTRIAVATMAPLDTRDLAFNNSCVVYGAGSVNSRGGLGISAFFGGGVANPTHFVGLWDESGGSGTFPFQLAGTLTSSQGPTSNVWGDYLSVEPLFPNTCAFQTSGYVLMGGGSGNNVQPFYTSFGRSLCFP